MPMTASWLAGGRGDAARRSARPRFRRAARGQGTGIERLQVQARQGRGLPAIGPAWTGTDVPAPVARQARRRAALAGFELAGLAVAGIFGIADDQVVVDLDPVAAVAFAV